MVEVSARAVVGVGADIGEEIMDIDNMPAGRELDALVETWL